MHLFWVKNRYLLDTIYRETFQTKDVKNIYLQIFCLVSKEFVWGSCILFVEVKSRRSISHRRTVNPIVEYLIGKGAVEV
jgi:hypothetical protein